MSNALILLPLGVAATAAGAALAGCGQPACHWSSLSAIALKTRLAMLKQIAPGRRRVRLSALGLTGLLCAGALAAYAAEPSAPQRLAAQAAGVVGSGDQLSLKFVEEGKERTLKPGDTYADGWKLDALTPTSATLVKDGQRQEVGLNPTGTLAAAAAAPPSVVRVAQSDDELVALAIERGVWDGKTPRPGLTLEQTRRYTVLNMKAGNLFLSYMADLNARSKAAGRGGVTIAVDRDIMPSVLGAEGAEYVALRNEEILNRRDLAAALYDRYGPVEVDAPTSRADPDGYRNAAKQRDTTYPGAAWDIKAGADANSQTYVMRPPDPAKDKLLPTEIPLLEDIIGISPSGARPTAGTQTAAPKS